MQRAIQGNPFKALIELILNADDSYRRLEDLGIATSGIIEIEFERERSGGDFAVRDFGEGMAGEDAITNMTDWGGSLSGHATGGTARGFFARGGKDALFEMTDGKMITCKNNVITELTFEVKNEERGVDDKTFTATPRRRASIGILSGNGTVCSFKLPPGARVPHFDTVRETLTTLYPLRKVLSNSNRDVRLKYRGESVQLRYESPAGTLESTGTESVGTDKGAMSLNYEIFVAPNELDQVPSERREGGLLIIDEADAVIDLSLFRYDRDPDAERLFGEIKVVGLRDAMRRDQTLVTEERDGFNRQNKTALQIISAVESLLDPVLRRLREQKKRDDSQMSTKTKQKVKSVTDALNALAGKITGASTGPVGGSGSTAQGGKPQPGEQPEILPEPILAIPASLTLTPKTLTRVSIYFKTEKCKGDVIVDIPDNDEVEFSPESFVIDETDSVFRHDIDIIALLAGTDGHLMIVNDGGELEIPFRVVAEVYPKPENGFAFVPDSVSTSVGRARTLELFLDAEQFGEYGDVTLTIDDETVAQLDKTSMHYDTRNALEGVVRLPVRASGLKVGAETIVRAQCNGFEAVCAFAVVSRRGKKTTVGGLFSGIAWDNNKFPKCNYRSDDAKIVIHTQEPSLALLGVSELSFENDRAVQVAVAEAVTQAACQRITEQSVPGQGKRRAYLTPGDPVKKLQEDYAFIQELTKDVGPVVYKELVENLRQNPAPLPELIPGRN